MSGRVHHERGSQEPTRPFPRYSPEGRDRRPQTTVCRDVDDRTASGPLGDSRGPTHPSTDTTGSRTHLWVEDHESQLGGRKDRRGSKSEVRDEGLCSNRVRSWREGRERHSEVRHSPTIVGRGVRLTTRLVKVYPIGGHGTSEDSQGRTRPPRTCHTLLMGGIQVETGPLERGATGGPGGV